MNRKSKIITIRNFHATKLNNDRDIFIYLPQSYDTEVNKRYPVLYMHDGQYAFKKSENTGASWNANLTADRLISNGQMIEIIIVAVPNMSNEKGSEYLHGKISFIKDPNFGIKGLLYEDFLINDLKPYIDKKFRTLTDYKNTALLGSSMGGLVTYNIGFRNPQIFGNLAMMSPCLVSLDPETLKEDKNYKLYNGEKPHKVWTDIGEYENLILEKHVTNFVDEMIEKGFKQGKNIVFYSVPGAAHYEADWAERLSAPLLYFFGNVGNKKSAELCGRKVVGLNGIKARINTVVKYDSGFAMSDINAKYIVENPEILGVLNDGTVIPKKEGKTNVTYVSDGVESSDIYTVVKEISDFVTISVDVKIPENTPKDKPITLNGYKLKKIDDCHYVDKIKLPRDCGFIYKIARGYGFSNPSETDKNKKRIKYRRFKATSDLNINCTVEGWSDI